jgi:hypothetical protein
VKLTPRSKLLLIAAFFALPIAASLTVYRFFPPEPTANYGELILPPQSLVEDALSRPGGGAFRFGELRDRWILVASDSGACDSQCAAKLHFVQSFSDKDGGLGVHPLAPTWPRKMLSTILFQEFGPKTLITVYWAPFEATEVERKTFEDGRDGMNAGWSGTFERLDADLEENA